jgi:hypothetical protein
VTVLHLQTPHTPPGEPYAVAEYRFAASAADELEFDSHDIILLKRAIDDDWVYAQNVRTYMFGIAPLAYMRVMVPLVQTPLAARIPSRQVTG